VTTTYTVGLEFKPVGRGLNQFESKVKQLERNFRSPSFSDPFKGVDRSAQTAGRSVQSAGRAARTASAGFSALQASIAPLLAALASLRTAQFVFVKTAELETQVRSLKVLTGSLEQAKDIIKELQQVGAVTPFTSTELIDTAKRLTAFGVAAENVVDVTKQLADVSGATGAELAGVATAYGQVVAKGRLQGEELLQFQERGVALAEQLRKQYNLTGEEFQKALEKGKISAEAVQFAIQELTDAGGKYADGAIAQSDTLAGKLSTLQDGIEQIARAIGQVLTPAIDAVLTKAINATNAVQRLLNVATNAGSIQERIPDFRQSARQQAVASTRRQFGIRGPEFTFDAQVSTNPEAQKFYRKVYNDVLNSLVDNALKYGGNFERFPVGVQGSTGSPRPTTPPPLTGGRTGGAGSGAGVAARDRAVARNDLSNTPAVIEYITGDPRAGSSYRKDHDYSLYHDHIAFSNKSDRDYAIRELQKRGFTIGSTYRPGDPGYHGSNQAIDIPAYPNLSNFGLPDSRSGTNMLSERVRGAIRDIFGGAPATGPAIATGAGPIATMPDPQEMLRASQQNLAIEQQRTRALREQEPLELAMQQRRSRDQQIRVAAAKELNNLLKDNANDETLRNTYLKAREELTQSQVQYEKDIAGIKEDQLQAEQDIADTRAGALRGVNDEIGLLKARLAGTEELYQRELDVRDLIESSRGTVSTVDAGKLVDERTRLQEMVDRLNEAQQFAQQLEQTLAQGVGSAIRGLIDGTKDLSDALADVAQRLGDILLTAGINSLFGGLIPGGLFTGLTGRASGGNVTSGQPYLVGENGPELFSPGQSGTISNSRAFGELRGTLDTFGRGAPDLSDDMGEPGPVQVDYSGAVLNFNGDQYVAQEDVPKIVDQAVKQSYGYTQNRLRTRPGDRRKLGMS